MIFKDFLTKLKKDGKITAAEFDAAIESAPEWDFPDKAVQAFEASFLTIDRAATDKSVHSKLKFEILNPVDNELKPLIAFLDTIDRFKASEIDKMTSTYDKIKALQAAIPEMYEKVKKAPTTDEDTKKKLKTFEETNQELLARIEKMNNEFSEKEKTFKSEYDKKISDFQLGIELEKLSNSFKFGKAYSDDTIRKDITKAKLDKLKATNHFKLVTTDDGQASIQVTDKEGKPLFKEGSNTAVTISQLLEEEFKPYIKASNAGDDDDDSDEGGGSEPQTTKRFKVPDGNSQIRQGARTTVV